MPKKIFVTGGAGYIGSHVCVKLLHKNHEVLVFDNLSNSSEEALRRVETVTKKKPKLVIGDMRDDAVLAEAFQTFAPDRDIHLAGLKADSNTHLTLPKKRIV